MLLFFPSPAYNMFKDGLDMNSMRKTHRLGHADDVSARQSMGQGLCLDLGGFGEGELVERSAKGRDDAELLKGGDALRCWRWRGAARRRGLCGRRHFGGK